MGAGGDMQPASADIDVRQAVRLRRWSLAVCSYGLALALLAAAEALGFIHAEAALGIGLACIAANGVLYAAFRTGFNLRFADPSLTQFQVYMAMALLMAALYYVDVARGISLGLCFLVALFGVFRMSTRELVRLALFTLAAYALVINLLMHFRPQAIQNVPQEWYNWLLLAVSLPWFGVVGG